jgi:hypothetical protein
MCSVRRWKPGDEIEVDGVRFRVVAGKKTPNGGMGQDLRLDWWTGGRWQAVGMGVGFLLADFFFENEEVLYPQALGHLGGKKYLRFVKHAAERGWRYAVVELRAEQEARLPL